MQILVDSCAELELHSLRNIQPVQTADPRVDIFRLRLHAIPVRASVDDILTLPDVVRTKTTTVIFRLIVIAGQGCSTGGHFTARSCAFQTVAVPKKPFNMLHKDYRPTIL